MIFFSSFSGSLTGSEAGWGCCTNFLFPLTGAEVLYISQPMIHFFGQTSTHALQIIHLNGSISQLFSFLFTVRALEGHFLLHIPQKMHLSISISMWPLVLLNEGLVSIGYFLVAGFVTRLFITLPIISNITFYLHLYIPTPYI